MRARSAKFDEAIINGAQIVSEAVLYRGTERLRTLPVLGGSWTEDQTASVRSSAQFTLGAENPEDVVPSNNPLDTSGLWPTGNEIQLRCGVKYRDGSKELLDIGRFRISKPKAAMSVDGGIQVTVDAYDRSRSMSRSKFVRPYGIFPGKDYATAIADLVQSRVPWIPRESYEFMRTDGYGGNPKYTSPGAIFVMEDDPVDKVMEMAASFGAEFFFNERGAPVLQPIPQLGDQAVWAYRADETSLLTELSRELDDELAYNGLIVTGINSESVVVARAEKWDTDPLSPTYYDPAFPDRTIYGAVPSFMTSEFITSQAQAVAAAYGNFPRVTGVIEAIDFTSVPHFAHQAGDVIRAEVEKLGVEGHFILESFTCGITHADTLAATTRRRQL